MAVNNFENLEKNPGCLGFLFRRNRAGSQVEINARQGRDTRAERLSEARAVPGGVTDAGREVLIRDQIVGGVSKAQAIKNVDQLLGR